MSPLHSVLIFLLIGSATAANAEPIEGASAPQKLNLIYQKTALSITVSFSDPDQFMDAGQGVALKADIKNEGPGKAYAVNAKLTGSFPKGLTVEKTVSIGLILPGETKQAIFKLAATDDLPDGDVPIMLSIGEKFNQVPSPVVITLACRAIVPPDIVIADNQIIDAKTENSYGDGNGIVVRGETVEIPLLVQNIGQGEALGVDLGVDVGNGLLPTTKTEFSLGDMRSGEERKVFFAFSVPENYSGSEKLPIMVRITEKKNRYWKTIPLPRPVELGKSTGDSGELKPQQVSIKGRQRTTTGTTISPGKLDTGIDIAIPVTGVQNPDALAVVIGNRDYQDQSIPMVEFAQNDAQTMKEYLVRVFGYKPGNIFCIPNATFAQMREYFGTENDSGELANHIKQGRSDVFVYYSGHGAPDVDTKRPFFVPVDCGTNPTSLRTNGYSVDLLYKKLADLPARSVTLVVDACFSSVSDASPIGIEIADPLRPLNNGAVFTSCTKNEISNWYREYGHGLYTYVFLSLLRKMIESGNKRITAGEIAEKVADANEGVPYLARSLFNGRTQTPQFRGESSRVLVEMK